MRRQLSEVFVKKLLVTFVIAFSLASSHGALASPGPVDPLELARSSSLGNSRPNVSPAGLQVLTYSTAIPGGVGVKLVERLDGDPFTDPIQLSSTANAETPALTFTPEGGIYAIWGIATTGAKAEQSYRVPGGEFTAASQVNDCRRFVDSATGPAGEIGVACSHDAASAPPNTYRFATSPALGPLTVTDPLISPVYDNFILPELEWGADGTIAIVADYFNTTTNPPPANETKYVRVDLRNPSIGLVDAAIIANATEPNEVEQTGAVVLDDGTVAVTTAGSAGAKVYIRPPGIGQSFALNSLGGDGATSPSADSGQNLHVMTVEPEPPDRKYWSQVRAPGGVFGAPVPIPLAGTNDPYIPFRGFHVAPDGTEFAVIRAGDGTYVTSHAPTDSGFGTPRPIGGTTTGNPEGAITSDGDLLLSWVEEISPTEDKLMVGGWDSGKPPVVSIGDFPDRVEPGAETAFSASAVDAMGIRSTGWDFGDGTNVAGDTATHSFAANGKYEVSYTATDRAGNETVEKRTVQVGDPVDPKATLKLKAPKRIKFRALKRKGLKLILTARPAMRFKVRIGTSKKRLRRKPLAVRSLKKPGTRRVLKLKPKRRKLGRPRKFTLFAQVRGTTAAGKTLTRTARVKVRR